MPVHEFNVVIVGGVLNVGQGQGTYYVDTENSDPTDIITSIVGLSSRAVYELHVLAPGQYWTLNHNPAGAIRLQHGLGFVTANPDDFIILRANTLGSYVTEFSRATIHAT